jgi:hypothetical protein
MSESIKDEMTMPLNAVKVFDKPVLVWMISCSVPTDLVAPPFDWVDLRELDPCLIACAFRGVGVDRLGAVLRSGIDVEPSDSVIYVDFFDKAWEYGGMPKVILALDRDFLDGTWRKCRPMPRSPNSVRFEQSFRLSSPVAMGKVFGFRVSSPAIKELQQTTRSVIRVGFQAIRSTRSTLSLSLPGQRTRPKSLRTLVIPETEKRT